MPTLTDTERPHHNKSWLQSDLKSEMAKKPDLRLATLNVPMHMESEVINGKLKLKGLRLLTNIVHLFEKAGFNLTLVPVGEPTSGIADENGTYNGLYGAVQSGKADTAFCAAPLRLAESIGLVTPIITDAGNVIATKREPIQEIEGTLYDCLTTLGPLNNILLVVIVGLILIFLSLLVSKRASWNFFARLMTEHFVHFRPLSLQLTVMVTLLMVRALFGSAYSTDVTIANPPKLINSLEDLAKSKLLPIWFEGDTLYLEFKQEVTKAHADVFNMGLKNRTKTVSMSALILADYKPALETKSVLYVDLGSSSLTKYVCKYKSSQVCSGEYRMFISKPFSRTDFVFVYSKNISESTSNALKKYANQFLQQSLFGNTFKSATDEFFPPSPECENEVTKGVEAVAPLNIVRTKFVPWWQTICALIAAIVILFLEIVVIPRI